MAIVLWPSIPIGLKYRLKGFFKFAKFEFISSNGKIRGQKAIIKFQIDFSVKADVKNLDMVLGTNECKESYNLGVFGN